MRADSRCLFRKAFSAPPAARHTPRGGSGVPTAGSMRLRPGATRRAGDSWRRRSPSSSSGLENERRTTGVPVQRSARLANAAADRSRAARNRNVLSSAVKVPLRSNNNSSRSRKGSSVHAGAGAAVVAARDRQPGDRKARARSPALHRIRISLARRDRLSRRSSRVSGGDPPRLHPLKVARVGAIASAASAAGAVVVGAVVRVAVTLRQSRRRRDYEVSSLAAFAGGSAAGRFTSRYRTAHSEKPSQRMQ